MNVKTMIVFPYMGYDNNEQCEYFFWWTIEKCKAIDKRPVVVLCRDTVIHNRADSFLRDKRYHSLDVIQTWSVDTCQTWLAGWGHILDNYPSSDRIIQTPGDIDYIHEQDEFYENLEKFIETNKADIAIGDFGTGSKYSAKGLVDLVVALRVWHTLASRRRRAAAGSWVRGAVIDRSYVQQSQRRN